MAGRNGGGAVALPKIERVVGTSLRTRVLLLIVAALILVGVVGWFGFQRIVSGLTYQFGMLVAERQVQYDRYRGMAVLNRELSLSESFTRAPTIRAWLANESDPDLMARGLAEMNHYRETFSNGSAFVIVNASGNYYFNDDQDSYGEDPLRYTLEPGLPRDAWYYATRQLREGCHLNVNSDAVLNVSKVWMNCIVSQGGEVLGMVGTGLDLSNFIREVVDNPEPGFESMFVDQSGAVQAHSDASQIDFASISKDFAQKNTVFSLFDTPSQMAGLRTMMSAATANPEQVQTALFIVGDRPVIVGVGYLDHIGWFNISLVDAPAIIGEQWYLPIGLAALAVLLATALILSTIFRIAVLDRLARLEKRLDAMRRGKRATIKPDRSNDEIGRLSRSLIEMSDAIVEAQMGLDDKVRRRTEDLQALVNHDELTHIFNRRGFEERYIFRAKRRLDDGKSDGIILLDIDDFKAINDVFAHEAGNQVLVEIAQRFDAALRKTDICARWGADVFAILVRDCNHEGLEKVARGLQDLIGKKTFTVLDSERIALTATLGAVVAVPGDAFEVVMDLAEAALYAAKEDAPGGLTVFERSEQGDAADGQDMSRSA